MQPQHLHGVPRGTACWAPKWRQAWAPLGGMQGWEPRRNPLTSHLLRGERGRPELGRGKEGTWTLSGEDLSIVYSSALSLRSRGPERQGHRQGAGKAWNGCPVTLD